MASCKHLSSQIERGLTQVYLIRHAGKHATWRPVANDGTSHGLH